MKDDFLIKIETWHKPDAGMQENVSVLGRNFGVRPFMAAVLGQKPRCGWPMALLAGTRGGVAGQAAHSWLRVPYFPSPLTLGKPPLFLKRVM